MRTNSVERENKGVHTSNISVNRQTLDPRHCNHDTVLQQQQCGDGVFMDNKLNDTNNDSQLTTTEGLDYSELTTDATTTTATSNLYKLRTTVPIGIGDGDRVRTPEKIEFCKFNKKICSTKLRCSKSRSLKHNRSRFPSKSECCSQCKNDVNKTEKGKLLEDQDQLKNDDQIPFITRLSNTFTKMISRVPDGSFPTAKFTNNSNNGNYQKSPTLPTNSLQSDVRNSENQNFLKDRQTADVYYFDHGNSSYYCTTDQPPLILTEILSKQTTYYATKFWAEIFGTLHIGIEFFIAFILQAYKLILYCIIRSLLIGLLQITSDYFLKPFLTVIFNGFLQPIFILFYNIFSSICDALEPTAVMLNNFAKPFATIFGSIRFINIVNRKVILRGRNKTTKTKMQCV